MRRSLPCAVVSLALTLSLTACDPPPPQGRLAIQRAGDSLRVLVCESSSADVVLMEQRGPATNGDWTTFFEYNGDAHVSAGDVVTTEQSITNFGATEYAIDPELHDIEYSLLFTGGGATLHGDFEIGPDGIPSDTWMYWDGTTSDAPCGAAPTPSPS